MLHPASRRTGGEVIDEQVTFKWPITHPPRLCGCDLLQRIDDGWQVVIGRIGIDYDAILRAVLRKIVLGEVAKLAWTVHQAIVVRCTHNEAGGNAWAGWQRVRRQSGREFPSRWDLLHSDRNGKFTSVGRIHEQLSKVQECMMLIELRAEWPCLVEHDVVVDHHPARLRTELPGRLIDLMKRKRFAGLGGSLYGDYVLCKITNLIQGVPDRELNLVAAILRIEGHADVYAMMGGIGEDDRVVELGFVLAPTN